MHGIANHANHRIYATSASAAVYIYTCIIVYVYIENLYMYNHIIYIYSHVIEINVNKCANKYIVMGLYIAIHGL